MTNKPHTGRSKIDITPIFQNSTIFEINNNGIILRQTATLFIWNSFTNRNFSCSECNELWEQFVSWIITMMKVKFSNPQRIFIVNYYFTAIFFVNIIAFVFYSIAFINIEKILIHLFNNVISEWHFKWQGILKNLIRTVGQFLSMGLRKSTCFCKSNFHHWP